MNRRNFLQGTALAAGAAMLSNRAAAEDTKYTPFKHAVQWGKIPGEGTDEEKIAIAKRCGMDGIEAYPMEDLDAAKRRGELAREAGCPIHSVTYGGWSAPMSDPSDRVIAKGHAEIENALRTTHAMGADVMLLVPAVVNDRVGYAEAWENSQKNIRPMIPLADELGVTIAVENVWNKFLLSPLEFAAYVDEFDTPTVRAYFDIGNVVIFGYPEDWIRTLGDRIVRLHWKDFTRQGSVWSKLPYEGDVNWREVRKALDEIGYTGWGTEEFGGADEAWLTELVRRLKCVDQGQRRCS